jgi:hypothetical protein
MTTKGQALDDLEGAGYDVYEQVAVMWAQGWPGGRVPFGGRDELHLCFENGRTLILRARRRTIPAPAPIVVDADGESEQGYQPICPEPHLRLP